MPETNEKNTILQNLKYIGLDCKNLPPFLKTYEEVEYQPSKAYTSSDFKVYRTIPINEIQILLTSTNRLDSMTKKLEKALPLCEYLKNDEENNVVYYAQFLKMVEGLNREEIEKMEQEQKQFKEKVPFKVKYETNYLWEIYYSEYSGKYFMLVTTEDQNRNALFYIIKHQIECWKHKKQDTIFVPISSLDYTKRYLKKSELADLEKYIWIFTKEWPNIYEVFDLQGNLTVHIVGTTVVYDKMKSYYKTKLCSKEEAIQFYTLVKALFILQTELPHYYVFETQIDEKGSLQFEWNNKSIHYANLAHFITEEYQKKIKELQEALTEKEQLDIALEKLKEDELEKNKEFLFREKQVATYMECRKTTFGKIKYFFRSKNTKFSKEKRTSNPLKEIIQKNEMEQKIATAMIENKEQYTIEDLIKICIELDRFVIRIKESKMDSQALQEKIKMVESKIKNATLFLEEIEEHKKSILEFWRFANKDLPLGLKAGEDKEPAEQKKKIAKAFDYEADIEALGIEADQLQRNIFSEEEKNSFYLATTSILQDMNRVRAHHSILEGLKIQKEEYRRNKAENIHTFDIFGNIKNDKTKISVLANQKHRESEKDAYTILELTEDTSKEEYEHSLTERIQLIENGLSKMYALTDCNIYFCASEKLNPNYLQLFYLNPIDAINAKEDNEKNYLYKLKIKEGMHLVYHTNCIYYDNQNHTLPIGMDVQHTVTFDMQAYQIDLKKQKIFRMNANKENYNFNEKIICVYEYEVKEK